MMNPAPPQGGAPQRPQGQAPSPQAPAPQPQGGGGGGGAEQLIGQVYQGLMQVKQLLSHAGASVPPEDQQLIDTCLKTYEQLVSSLRGPAQGQQPPQAQAPAPNSQAPARPSAPMPPHSSRGSKPAGF